MKNTSPEIAQLMLSAAADDSAAQFLLGYNYYVGNVDGQPNIYNAIHWLKQAIKKNNSDALYMLASIYIKEKPPIKNQNKAIELFQQAANLGNTRALYFMAMEYYKGEIIKKSIHNCIINLELAAIKHHLNSIIVLGKFYETGELFSKDISKALALYHFATVTDFKAGNQLYTKLIFKMSYDEIQKSKKYTHIDQILFRDRLLTA